jgi:hypothetical protein
MMHCLTFCLCNNRLVIIKTLYTELYNTDDVPMVGFCLICVAFVGEIASGSYSQYVTSEIAQLFESFSTLE